MNAFLSTFVLLAGLTQASSPAVSQRSTYQVSAQPATAAASESSSQPAATTGTVIVSRNTRLSEPFLPDQAQATVLVVPTPGLPAESLADLTADLTVMCRIFDKSAPPDLNGSRFYDGRSGNDVFRYVVRQNGGTQALYLDGYGALFFIDVDYPLVPSPEQEQAQAGTQESTDSVWSATVKEMSGQPPEEQAPGRNAPSYDAQKVENLKKALIQALVHASNIRMRQPQETITLVVGALDSGTASYYGRLRGYGTNNSRRRRSSGRVAAVASAAPATLMVLRVTKADADAFARNRLTRAQFTEKIQILFTPPRPRAPATPTPAPTPVNS